MDGATQPVGSMLRAWRVRRRMTQMDLALEAEVSTRHVSFLETGRAQPSRDMIERLANQLDIPFRERNALHLAAGFAPVHRESSLDDPQLAAARETVVIVLRGLEPYPAVAVDRLWNLVAANDAALRMFDGIAPELLAPPINVLRTTFHPDGLAPAIANLAQWREHTLARIDRVIERTADPALVALREELASYPFPATSDTTDSRFGSLAVPLQLHSERGLLSFLYTTTLFGSPPDLTLSEIAIEAFFPADASTATAFRADSGT